MEYTLINHWTNETLLFKTFTDVMWHLNCANIRTDNPYLKDEQYKSLEVWRGDVEWYYVALRRGNLCITLEGAGTVQELLTSMMDEVMPYALRADGSIKRPFEMTPSQWGAINMIGSVAYGVYTCFTTDQLSKPIALSGSRSGGPVELLHQEFMTRFGYGHNGPTYGNGGDINCRHELHVGYALLRGEDVPQVVLDETRKRAEGAGFSDCAWIRELLKKPYLRGAFKEAYVFSVMRRLLLSEQVQLDEGNFRQFADLVNVLPTGATHIDVDDALFDAGHLHERPLPPLTHPCDGSPLSDFASRVRDEVLADQKRTRVQQLEANKHRLSKRDIGFERALIERLDHECGYTQANRLAQAMDSKDLPVLLAFLDGSMCKPYQRAVEREFGVKLVSANAVQRRRAIFKLAGFVTDEAIAAHEAVMESQRLERVRVARLRRNRDEAASNKFLFDGVKTDGAALIEQLVAQGFNRIESKKTGAATLYYLCHPDTRKSLLVTKKMGTLDYARSVLEAAPVKRNEVAETC